MINAYNEESTHLLTEEKNYYSAKRIIAIVEEEVHLNFVDNSQQGKINYLIKNRIITYIGRDLYAFVNETAPENNYVVLNVACVNSAKIVGFNKVIEEKLNLINNLLKERYEIKNGFSRYKEDELQIIIDFNHNFVDIFLSSPYHNETAQNQIWNWNR